MFLSCDESLQHVLRSWKQVVNVNTPLQRCLLNLHLSHRCVNTFLGSLNNFIISDSSGHWFFVYFWVFCLFSSLQELTECSTWIGSFIWLRFTECWELLCPPTDIEFTIIVSAVDHHQEPPVSSHCGPPPLRRCLLVRSNDASYAPSGHRQKLLGISEESPVWWKFGEPDQIWQPT